MTLPCSVFYSTYSYFLLHCIYEPMQN